MTTTTELDAVALAHHRSWVTGHSDGWEISRRGEWSDFHRALGFARNVLAQRSADEATAYVLGLYEGVHGERQNARETRRQRDAIAAYRAAETLQRGGAV